MVGLVPLPAVMIEPVVRSALLEDLGRVGDITSNAMIAPGTRAAMIIFRLIDPRVDFLVIEPDGSHVEPGDVIVRVEGPAAGLLTAERTALNFLCRLSGIATATAALVRAVVGHKAAVVCTRKTTPGLRAVEKYAVRAGGGANHRFGLDDVILIKDNHVALAGGVRPALQRARAAAGHLVKIELEVDTLDQLEEALSVGVDAVLLDNMSIADLRAAVALVSGRAVTEASGRVTVETAPAIAATGVDIISVGWITHSAPALDIGLDFAHRL
jgi:nicotinate-nucleotide pyrophosphorylase (carboxylating)